MTRVLALAGAGWLALASWAPLTGASAAAAAAQSSGAPIVEPTAARDRVSEHNTLVRDYCATCHSAAAGQGGLVLQGFDLGSPLLTASRIELLIRKLRAGQMPPSGAPRPPAEALAALVTAFEARADAMAARAPDPGWRPLARLNRAEYTRVVKDLLAVDIDAAALLPPDTASGGFDNIADVQTASPALISAYLRGAAAVSRLAVGAPSRASASRRRLFVCRPVNLAAEAACARTIVGALTARALRGRAESRDVADAYTFYERGRRTGSFDDGIRLAVQSVLVSPKFLFRLEPLTADGQLDDLALASRLSFFLWSRGPDEALLAAAQRGELHTPQQLTAQARRLLRDERAETVSTRFAGQWLRLQDLTKVTVDPGQFPGFDAALAADMRRETELVVADLIRRDAPVMDLVTSRRTFVNERLATHYGLAGVRGPAFRPVTMPPTRFGLLGHASILTLTSVGARTSPVLRGKWVLEVLLGTPPPPPPPNVPALDETAATTAGGTPLSTRQRVEAHRRSPACASCHRVIDPPGLTLEHFDPTGAWRDIDNGVAVEATAALYDGREMTGAAGLSAALVARQDVVLRHFTEQLMAYALNRRLTARDLPMVRAIVTAAAANGQRVSDYVTGVVTSDAFRRSYPPQER